MDFVIDSSGRRALQINGTVLDIMPVGRIVSVTGGLLVLLFTLIKPEASSGLSLWPRALFWFLHIGTGLCALLVASRWLASRHYLPGSTLSAVIVTGLAGVILASPVYFVLDIIFEPYTVDLDGDDPAAHPILQLVIEIAELTPWFLATWLLINLPVLLPARATGTNTLSANTSDTPDKLPSTDKSEPKNYSTRTHLQPVPDTRDANHGTTQSVATTGPDIAAVAPNASCTTHAPAAAMSQASAGQQKFLLSLPGVIGSDIVAVSSDLHYLNVWTVAGRTTVLGSLRDVASELADAGMHARHHIPAGTIAASGLLDALGLGVVR